MSYHQTTICGRCSKEMELAFYEACPYCKKKDDVNVNYTTIYNLSNARLPEKNDNEQGIYRFRDFFALGDSDPVISIGEGDTPLRRLHKMGGKMGLEYLYMKDESKNPTMSHKDRMCSIIISKALVGGAPGVVIASTGNQGASTAAYCAMADIPCVIFTTPNVSSTMKTFMQVYGASVFVTPTMQDRSLIMDRLVRELGFVPASGLMSPPIGSSCFGIDGYKTIAFEIFEQMNDEVPDWFIVPVSYGDTLYGIYKGMLDLKEMGYIDKIPKFVSAEVFGANDLTLKSNSELPIIVPSNPSIQTSIATGYTTYLTVKAIRDSGGMSRISHDNEALEMQKNLATTEGIYAETASAASMVALQKLTRDKLIKQHEKVVVLMTSTGIKDPDTTNLILPSIPTIDPSIESFRRRMESCYGIKI